MPELLAPITTKLSQDASLLSGFFQVGSSLNMFRSGETAVFMFGKSARQRVSDLTKRDFSTKLYSQYGLISISVSGFFA